MSNDNAMKPKLIIEVIGGIVDRVITNDPDCQPEIQVIAHKASSDPETYELDKRLTSEEIICVIYQSPRT
jgi:hypothetical protein